MGISGMIEDGKVGDIRRGRRARGWVRTPLGERLEWIVVVLSCFSSCGNRAVPEEDALEEDAS